MKKIFNSHFFIIITALVLLGSFGTLAQDVSSGKIPQVYIDKFQGQNSWRVNADVQNNYGDMLATQGFMYGAQTGNTETVQLPSGTVGTLLPWTTLTSYASGMTSNGTLYYIIDVGDSVWTFNTGTGAVTIAGVLTSPVGANGIAFNPADGLYYLCSGTELYTLNVGTLTPTLVGSFGTGGLMIDLCFDFTGTCYGYDVGTDMAYTINTSTGVATALGALGFNANFGQGMGYDFETGQIYLTAFDGPALDGQLRVMDPETGYTNLLASFGLNQKDPFVPQSTPAALPGPGRATGPSPANGATGTPITADTDLMWTNAAGATSIEIFFGTDPLALSSIYSGAPITSGSVTTAYSTQYFWRVDQTDGSGTTQGTLWSFTTEALPCVVGPLPAYEDFDGGVFPPLCWSQTGVIWIALDNGAPNNVSAVADFYSNPAGFDDLVSLEYTSTGAPNPMLTFDWAYAIYPGATDHLEIYESTDQGATWSLLADMYNGAPGDDELNPFGLSQTGAYFPGVNEWTTRSIMLSANTTNVKFTAVTDYGNLLWLDNIQITSELYTTSFEDPPFSFPGFVAAQDPTNWTTWSGPPYTNEDAQISQTYAHDGVQSALIDFVAPRDVDLVYLAPGNPKTAGKWYMNFWLYIPTGGTGYFNTQATFQTDWGMECYFNAGGAGLLDNGSTIPFVWEEDTWHQVMMVVDLNTGMAEFWFGKNVITQLATWDWTRGGTIPNTLDGYDFFGAAATDQMFMDEFRFSDKAPPILQAADDAGTLSIDFATQVAPGTFAPTATVKNFGTATNSFDVTMTISPSYTSTKTVTDLVGGATEQITFDNYTGATGGPSTVTVTTALTGDEDPTNDTKSQVLYVWDPSGTWSSGSLMPGTTYLGSGTSYTTTVGDATNGYLFSIGGNTDNTFRDQCWKYEVDTDTWTSIAPLPAGRVILATATVGDYIYAIGGSDGTNYQSNVARYDIGADTWSAVTSLPVNNGWCKAVAYNDGSNDYIFLAGGYDGVSANYFADVWVYDVGADTWTNTGSPMPGGKIGGAFSITGNTLVYVGGADDAGGISNDVYVGTIVSPTVINWTVSDSPYPGTNERMGSRFGEELTAFVKGRTNIKKEKGILAEGVPYPPGSMFRFDAAPWGTDGIILAGGDPNGSFDPAVPNPAYIYTPSSDTWVALENVPLGVVGSSLGSFNDGNTWKLVMASGIDVAAPDSATQIYTQTVSGGSTFAFNVSVDNGWNMVSVPGLHPTNQNVETWWSGKDPGAGVFKYAGGYTQVTVATPTEGYWMKNLGQQTYNYTGIQVVPHNDVPLALGWNLIGLYENTVAVPLTTTPPGIITTGIFEYNGGYQTATSLVPGFAYWVKADAVGSITGLSAPPLGKDVDEVAEFFNEKWGKIILTDATGTSYTLYAVAGEVDLNKYELPPMPPAGVFDIRYGSGRIAEDLSSSQSIELSGVQYPLTVRVENMTLALQDAAGRELNSNLNPGQEVTISDKSVNKLIVLSNGLSLPTEYALEQNYPNPFNPSTTIKFALPEAANVSLSIYNTLGEKVAEVVNSRLEAGRYTYQWNAGNVATGMYIYELRTDNYVSVKKMLLLK